MTSSVSFGAWILTQLLTSKPAMGAERTEFSCLVFVHVFGVCVLLVQGRVPEVQLASNSLRSLGLGMSEPVPPQSWDSGCVPANTPGSVQC